MQYIFINNWENFQQYKDRRPTWIKLLIEIIDEFDADGNPKKYYAMSDSAKTTFLHLLCLRANYNEKIPYPNDKWLKKRLGLRRITLQPLVDAGFIIIENDSVSNPYNSVQNRTEMIRQRESKSKRESKSICTELFDIFWKKYPRKEAKQRAVTWFTKNRPTEKDVEKMQYTIRKQSMRGGRLERRLREHMKYIPLPATWLNDGDWQDAPSEMEVKQQAEETVAKEQQALEKKRQQLRDDYTQCYREKTIEELKTMREDKTLITHWWLIDEIIAKRNIK